MKKKDITKATKNLLCVIDDVKAERCEEISEIAFLGISTFTFLIGIGACILADMLVNDLDKDGVRREIIKATATATVLNITAKSKERL